jgi:hypothetical protein
LQVEVGGQALGEFEPPKSELIGLGFAIVILILSFGSVLAMGLPIGVALFGVGIGAGLITLLSNVISVPDFAVTLGAMIGIGVGIDYASSSSPGTGRVCGQGSIPSRPRWSHSTPPAGPWCSPGSPS